MRKGSGVSTKRIQAMVDRSSPVEIRIKDTALEELRKLKQSKYSRAVHFGRAWAGLANFYPIGVTYGLALSGATAFIPAANIFTLSSAALMAMYGGYKGVQHLYNNIRRQYIVDNVDRDIQAHRLSQARMQLNPMRIAAAELEYTRANTRAQYNALALERIQETLSESGSADSDIANDGSYEGSQDYDSNEEQSD
jgi:hypothetical protein